MSLEGKTDECLRKLDAIESSFKDIMTSPESSDLQRSMNVMKGYNLVNAKRYSEALLALSRALNDFPEQRGILLCNLGLCMCGMNRPKEGLEYFDRALSEQLDDEWKFSTLNYKALAHWQIGNLTLARKELEICELMPGAGANRDRVRQSLAKINELLANPESPRT